MADKVVNRGIKIWLDGKLVTASVKEIRQELNKLIKDQLQMKIGADDYVRSGEKIKYLNKLLNEHYMSLRSSTNEYNRIGNIVKGVFGGSFLLAGVQKIGQIIQGTRQFIDEGVKMASAAQGIQHAFDRIADTNYLESLRKQTKGLVSDFVLMKSAVRAENFNIPLSELGKLLEFAQNRARDTGESVDYLVESIITGIGRKSPLILDNLGISSVRLQEEVKKTGDFAVSVGKIIDEEMAKAGQAIDTATDAATRKKVAWENLQLTTGKFFTGFKNGWDNYVSSFVDGIAEILSGQEKSSVQFENQINKLSDLNTTLPPLIQRYEELRDKTELTTKESDELNSIMTKITEIIPTAAVEFDKYGNVLALNTQKVWDFIDAETAKLEVMNKDAIKEQTKSLKEYETELAKVNKMRQGGEKSIYIQTSSFGTGMYQFVALTDDELRELDKQADELERNILGTQTYINELTGKSTAERIQTRATEIKKEAEFNKMSKAELDKYIKNYGDQSDKFIEIAKKVYSHRFGTGTETEPGVVPDKKPKKEKDLEINVAQEERKIMNSGIRDLEIENYKELAKIKQDYIADDKKTEEQYNQELLDKQRDFLEKKKLFLQDTLSSATDPEVQADIKKQIETLNNDLLDLDVNYRNQVLANLKKEQDESIKLTKENADKRKQIFEKYGINELTTQKDSELAVIDEYERLGILTHEEALRVKAALDDKYLQEEINKRLEGYYEIASSVNSIFSDLSGTMDNLISAEENRTALKYDKQIKAARKAGKDTTKLEEKKEEEIAKIRAKNADKQFVLTIASVIASTAMAAIDAYANALKIPIVGPALAPIAAAAAVAFGGSQIAVAKQQRDAAKEGYFIGGFTGGDDPREVRGYFPDGQPYHGKEFVVNHRGVSNPNIRPVLDAFDMAQRTGTISSMSKQDIARALNVNTANTTPSSGSNDSARDSYVYDTIDRLAKTVERLSNQIDEGIPAIATISGEKGIAKKLDEFNRLTKHARG